MRDPARGPSPSPARVWWACALAALGGCGLLQTRPAGPPTDEETLAAIRSLRLFVDGDLAIKTEGDVAPDFPERLRAMIEAELKYAGIELVADAKAPRDLTLRMDAEVRGAPLFLFGRASLTVLRKEDVIDLIAAEDEIHKKDVFAARVAWRLVDGFLRSQQVGALARDLPGHDRPRPKAIAASHERPNADDKPAPEAIAAARDHARRARSLFDLGKFDKAMQEYEAAYLAVPNPTLLFNMGQCQRKLGNGQQALAFYKSYLRNQPDAPNRAEVEKLIRDLEGKK